MIDISSNNLLWANTHRFCPATAHWKRDLTCISNTYTTSGNESNESILEAYGMISKDKQISEALRSKRCPNCNEPNKPDSKFCANCRVVLTYDAYSETLESEKKKEDRVSVLEKQMQSLISTHFSKITEQGQVWPFRANLSAICDPITPIPITPMFIV